MLVADPKLGELVLLEGRGAAEAFRLAAPRRFQVDGGPLALALLPEPPALVVGLCEGGERLGVLLFERGEVEPWREIDFLPTERPVASLATGDLDGDGALDLAALCSGGTDVSPGSVHCWLARAGGWLALEPLTTSLAPHRIALGDLDLDGRADLVATALHSHHLNVWLSRGGAPLDFLRLADLGTGRGPLDLALADLDRDGRLDILVLNHYGASVATVLNPSPNRE